MIHREMDEEEPRLLNVAQLPGAAAGPQHLSAMGIQRSTLSTRGHARASPHDSNSRLIADARRIGALPPPCLGDARGPVVRLLCRDCCDPVHARQGRKRSCLALLPADRVQSPHSLRHLFSLSAPKGAL